MLKFILLICSLVSLNFANEYFLDFTFGNSLMSNYSEYTRIDKGGGEGLSAEGISYKIDIRAGYSFLVSESMFIEPSLGWGQLGSFAGGLKVDSIYSVEVSLYYKVNAIKYGFFAKYNYLADTYIEEHNGNIKVNDEEAISFGVKTIIGSGNINFIIAYEYILPGAYENTTYNGTEATYTKFDVTGSYLSVGIRVKF